MNYNEEDKAVVASVHHVVCQGTSDLRKRSPGVRQLAVIVALVMVAGGPFLWAQTTATLQGTISDGTGSPLPGVQVTVTSSQGSRTAITDPMGSYTVSGLPPGTYRMTASLNGFAPGEAEQIELTAGQTLTLNVTLESLTFGEEVLVTSGKRTQTLIEVPASITVLSGDTIEQNRVENLADFVPLVPGLTISTATAGVSRITLRGINTGGVASTVGVYVDDVPFGSSTGLANGAVLAGDFDTFDVTRTEVLRGPQGTLYGASSLAGVFRYITNQPTLEGTEARLLGSLETVEEGDLGYSVKGMVNVPAGDTVAFRASGFYRFDDGFIDSIGNNPIPSLTNPSINIVDGTLVEENLNSVDSFGGRFSALFQPSDEFSLVLMAQTQDIQSDGPNEVDADPVTLEPLNSDPVQSRYHANTVDTQYRIFSATADWSIGPAELVSVTSYGTFEQDLHVDAAWATGFTGDPNLALASVVTYYFGNDETRPLSAVLPQTTSTDKFTQELRLVSGANEALDWLVGGFYTNEDSEILQQIVAVEAGTDTPAAGIPVLADLALPSDYEEFALFGDATWHVTPDFDLSFGARGSWNDQTASQTAEGPLVGGSAQYPEASSSESPFTYSVSPRYELLENSALYARVATGFRPGGPNVLPPDVPPGTPLTYDSDTLTSYEAGFKTSSSGGRYALDLSIYYLDWEDIQLYAVVNGFGINANGGTATSKGFEFTASVVPATGLQLSLNGSYTDAYLTEDTDQILVGGLDGDALPYIPDWSFGLLADYEWTVQGDWTLGVSGIVGYIGERAFDYMARADDGELRTLDDYVTLDLRAAAFIGRWTFELYGKNLTDEMGIASVDTSGAYPNGAYGLGLIRPMTVGVSVGVRFWGS
jgi:outer membrane receptor protein involved in Fe transport